MRVAFLPFTPVYFVHAALLPSFFFLDDVRGPGFSFLSLGTLFLPRFFCIGRITPLLFFPLPLKWGRLSPTFPTPDYAGRLRARSPRFSKVSRTPSSFFLLFPSCRDVPFPTDDALPRVFFDLLRRPQSPFSLFFPSPPMRRAARFSQRSAFPSFFLFFSLEGTSSSRCRR